MLGLLFVGFAAGLIAADFGFFPRQAFGFERLAIALLSSAAFVLFAWVRDFAGIAAWAGGSAERRPRGGVHSSLIYGMALATAFFAGAIRLEANLVEARRAGATIEAGAESMGSRSIRILEARVVSRRTTHWGAWIELDEVAAKDGGPRIPKRLRLSMDEGQAFETGATDVAAEEGGVEVLVESRGMALLWPGVRVRLGVRLRPLRSASNPGSPERARGSARRGIGAQARLVDPDWIVVVHADQNSWLSPLHETWVDAHRTRADFQDRVAARFVRWPQSGGLARALVLGDRSGLPTDLLEALRRRGLAHLVAISGLHVTIVAAGLGWGTTRLWTRLAPVRRGRVGYFGVSLGAACIGAALYGWLAGAAVSVRRAAMLFAVFGAFRARRRTLPAASALSGVGLAILVGEPGALFQAGAQLSFGSCAGLIAAGFWGGENRLQPIQPRLPFWRRYGLGLIDSGRASLAISLATAPILFAFAMVFSPGAPLWNVLAIPWVAAIVLPSSILAVCGMEWLPVELLGCLLAPGEAFASAVRGIDGWVPHFRAHDALPASAALAFSAFGLLLLRKGCTRSPLLIWLAVACLGSAPWLFGPRAPDLPRLVFFDVGQGDAALVQGHRASIMIDSGGGRNDEQSGQSLVRGLRSLGVTSLDVLAVTHGDLDHRAGAKRILRSTRVDELWLPAGSEQDGVLVALADYAADRGTAVLWLARRPSLLTRGDLDVAVLWPPLPPPPPPSRPEGRRRARTRNDGSLVMRVDVAGLRTLFTADIGAAVEETLLLKPDELAADVLKVAHHGSRKSSRPDLIRAVDPTWAVVSAPCDAARGLPSLDVLRRLTRAGVGLAWTGRSGAQIFSVGVAPVAGTRDRSPRVESARVGDATAPPIIKRLAWRAPRKCLRD